MTRDKILKYSPCNVLALKKKKRASLLDSSKKQYCVKTSITFVFPLCFISILFSCLLFPPKEKFKFIT